MFIMKQLKACLMRKMSDYLGSSTVARALQFTFLAGILASLIAPFAGALVTTGTGGSTTISTVLCNIVTTVQDVLSILALMMFILGGTLYAFAHVLPATGNLRSSLQGWGMGILMGGIISLVLYIIAPYIINSLMAAGGSTNQTISCPGFNP